MSDLQAIRRLTGPAAAALEASRRRIDDLNVYPVPDGDTGTNLMLTVNAVRETLDRLEDADRERLARKVARAALMGARGNSGVILSQIVRGFAEVLGEARTIDSPVLARAFRSASDAAYRAVRRPVEGTMLTVIRELAEEAEARADPALPIVDLVRALVRRGEDALARTPQYLRILREAGVVDAGGAGLLELVRGLAAALSGEELPEPPAGLHGVSLDSVHRERSRYRYCTVFVVEGDRLDPDRLERELERLGDSLMVVGDRTALKVHVHTDEPGVALSLGVAQGTIDGVEIANMHRQTEEREERLLELVPDPPSVPAACDVVAVVAGAGNVALFRSLGARRVVEGGQSMNPATADVVAAIESSEAHEVIVLPNNPNVIMSAEQAVEHASKAARVVHTSSIPAGIAAMVSFDPARGADENAAEMEETVAAVATGAVTTASRDVELNGLGVARGAYLGLFDGEPVAGGADFEEVAEAVVETLLDGSRAVLTILSGEEAPPLNGLLDRIAQRHPEVEVDLQAGGQPHYQLLLSAE